MHDFTLDIYETLLNGFNNKGYVFSTFEEYVLNHKNKVVILKHDVDKLPKSALRMANLEKKIGIKTSYYFRTIDRVYDESIIEKIAGLGHEVGYHYEDLDLSWRGLRSPRLNTLGGNPVQLGREVRGPRLNPQITQINAELIK